MATTETEGYVGRRIPPLESAKYLRGRGKYVDDIQLPGTLHAAFLRSPFAHAKVIRVDAAAARALDGVALVLTAEDMGEIPAIVTDLRTRDAGLFSGILLP